MFTLSFYHHESEGKSVLSAARYSVVHGPGLVSVWVYPTLKEENPVLMDLRPDPMDNTYAEVFITNEQGKTIDRYRAHSLPAAA
jgi:hypothetical protein